MLPPKITNPTVIAPIENDLEELPDKEIGRMIVNMVRLLRDKQMNKMRRSVQAALVGFCQLDLNPDISRKKPQLRKCLHKLSRGMLLLIIDVGGIRSL